MAQSYAWYLLNVLIFAKHLLWCFFLEVLNFKIQSQDCRNQAEYLTFVPDYDSESFPKNLLKCVLQPGTNLCRTKSVKSVFQTAVILNGS